MRVHGFVTHRGRLLLFPNFLLFCVTSFLRTKINLSSRLRKATSKVHPHQATKEERESRDLETNVSARESKMAIILRYLKSLNTWTNPNKCEGCLAFTFLL